MIRRVLVLAAILAANPPLWKYATRAVASAAGISLPGFTCDKGSCIVDAPVAESPQLCHDPRQDEIQKLCRGSQDRSPALADECVHAWNDVQYIEEKCGQAKMTSEDQPVINRLKQLETVMEKELKGFSP